MSESDQTGAGVGLRAAAVKLLAQALARCNQHPERLLTAAEEQGLLVASCRQKVQSLGVSDDLASHWWDRLHELRNEQHHCIAAILWTHHQEVRPGKVDFPGGFDELIQALEDEVGQGGRLKPLESGAAAPVADDGLVGEAAGAEPTTAPRDQATGPGDVPIMAAAGADPAEVDELLEQLPQSAAEPEPPPDGNPYRYLGYFNIGDRLYGRDIETDDLIERVERGFERGHCRVGISGRSGCGKSSLLRAGLLDGLRRKGYRVAAVRPTDFHDERGEPDDVVRKLVRRLAADDHARLPLSGPDHERLAEAPRRRLPAITIELIEQAITAYPADVPGLVIGLDQLEEVVDDLAANPERSGWRELVEFIECADASPRIGLAYTLESSREALLADTPLAGLLADDAADRSEIDGFSRAFLSAVIKQPFRDAADRDLLPMPDAEVLATLRRNAKELQQGRSINQADSLLPLVALTLSRLFDWIQGQDWRDLAAAQRATAGLGAQRLEVGLDRIEDRRLDIGRAIEQAATEAWGERDPDEALGQFLRPLVGIADPGGDRLVLRQVPLHPYRQDRLVAESFLDQRLLVPDGGRVRLVHEALLRFWPPAAAWLSSHREHLRVERGQRDAARDWEQAGRELPATVSEQAIDDAADTLNEFFRSWGFLEDRDRDLNAGDRLLRDYCLALFAGSRWPKRRLGSSPKAGKCHLHLAAQYGQLDCLATFHALEPDCVDYPDAKGNTPLASAAWASDAAVAYLLEAGADAVAPNNNGWRPLSAAVHMGNQPIFERLVAAYSKAQLEDWPSGQTALHLVGATRPTSAPAAPLLAIAHYLVERRGLDPNARLSDGRTPLHQAAFQGQVELFKWLTGVGDINATDDDGWSALHYAASAGQLAIVHQLLDDPRFEQRDALDKGNRHALHHAVSQGRGAIVERLLDDGVNADVRAADGPFEKKDLSSEVGGAIKALKDLWSSSDDDGWDGILDMLSEQLVQSRDLSDETTQQVVEAIDKLKHQPDKLPELTSRQSSTSATPLHVAAAQLERVGQTEQRKRVTRGLIERLLCSADPNLMDGLGQTPLALVGTDKEARRMLLHCPRLDPNRPVTPGGSTPLLLAAEDQEWALTRALFARDTDAAFQSSDADGDGLLHLLCGQRAPDDLVLAAFDAAADRAPRNKVGATPLMVAIAHKRWALVRHILDRAPDATAPSAEQGTPLMKAVGFDAPPALLDALWDGSAESLALKDCHGWTALHIACARGARAASDWLVERAGEALFEQVDAWGRSPRDLTPPGVDGDGTANPALGWNSDLDWRVVDGEQGGRLRPLLAEQECAWPIDEETRIQSAELAFYDSARVRLLRLSDARHWSADGRRLYFIELRDEEGGEQEGPRLLRLDGSSSPIHELNEQVAPRLAEATALAYLRFFCFFVHGDEGPFLIAEGLAQPELADGQPNEDQDRLATQLRPARLLGRVGDDYRVSAAVYYGAGLFLADFVVHAGGMVEMVRDTGLLSELPRLTHLAID